MRAWLDNRDSAEDREVSLPERPRIFPLYSTVEKSSDFRG